MSSSGFNCTTLGLFSDPHTFLEGLLVCMRFLHLEDDVLRGGLLLFFQYSYRNLVRIRHEFRIIVFCRVDFYIYMLVLFLDRFENVLI